MELSFQTLVINEFRSIKRLELDLSRVGSGLHFFRGVNKQEPRLASNGAGKSSVFDALTWIPFGKTVRGLRSPDVVPWGKKKGTPSGTLELLIDGKPRVFERVVNELYLDGKPLSPDHIPDTLGLNYDVFVNTVVLGQGQPLFFDLPPRAKMQLFTDVLALERWEARSAFAGKETSAIERDLAEIEGQLVGVQANLDQTKADITANRKSLDDWEKDRLAQMKSLAKDVEELANKYAKAQARADKANLEHDSAGTQLKLVRIEDGKMRDALGHARAALAAHDAGIRGLESKLADMERDAKAFGTTDKCPVCGQVVTGTEFERHKNRLDRQINKQRAEINDAKAVDKFKNVVALLEKDIAANRKVMAEFETKVNETRAAYDLAIPQAVEAKSKLTFMQGKQDEWENRPNPYREQLTKLRKQQSKLEKEIEDLTGQSTAMQKRIGYTKFWVKGFKDVRLYIIDEVLQELELTTNAMLEEVGLLGWSVQYDIEKETKSGTIQRGLNVSIVSPASKTPAKWEAWSGGEGQRLRLVGALALSEVLLNYAGVSTDLEILDEPTRHLSSSGVRDLCEWLAVRAKTLDRRTFFVDHYAVDATYFASTFTVVKDNEGSHMALTR